MRRDRWILGVLVLGLVLWSARGVWADPTGLVWGDRADTIHHVWGHWWMAQSGAEGGITTWVSTPYGEYGSVLAPIGNWLTRPALWIGGAVLAYNLASVLYLLFDALAVGLLAARVSGSERAGGLAALALVVGRPLLLHVHLGNTEGAAIGWVALVIWLGLRWSAGSPRYVGPLIGLLSGIAVIENPYALPILAILAPALALRRMRQGERAWIEVLGAALCGLLVPGLRLLQIGSGLGGNMVRMEIHQWAGLSWPVYDAGWGFPAWQMLSPVPQMAWQTRTLDTFAAGGFSYLGLCALVLALVGLATSWRKALPWVLLTVLFGWMSLGSQPMGEGGAPGLFLFVDSVIAKVLPALTQPVRFLTFALASLAVAAAVGAQALERWPWASWVLAGLLVLEGLSVGGPAIEVPSLDLRGRECLQQLEGPVHTVLPEQGSAETLNGQALLLQMEHGQPGTHRGIGGWPAVEVEQTGSLEERGVRWVLVPEEGRSEISCAGWSAMPLQDWLKESSPPPTAPAPPPHR